MKIDKETMMEMKNAKVNMPCKIRKYWFDRKHKWRFYHNQRKVWAVCNHCLEVIKLIGEDDL